LALESEVYKSDVTTSCELKCPPTHFLKAERRSLSCFSKDAWFPEQALGLKVLSSALKVAHDAQCLAAPIVALN